MYEEPKKQVVESGDIWYNVFIRKEVPDEKT